MNTIDNNVVFFITIYNALLLADTISYNSVTIQNYTHVKINFFIVITVIITTKNIGDSFWITLYICFSIYMSDIRVASCKVHPI